jgi:hypothetical protein
LSQAPRGSPNACVYRTGQSSRCGDQQDHWRRGKPLPAIREKRTGQRDSGDSDSPAEFRARDEPELIEAEKLNWG